MRVSFVILAAYAALIIVLGGLRWSDWQIFAQYLMSAIPVWLLLTFVISVTVSIREVRKGVEGQRPLELARSISWRKFFWPPLLYTVLLGFFAIFKQRILPSAGFTFDQTFYQWDKVIFGTDPWRLSHPSPWLTELLGASYYGWYAPMMLGILAVAFVVARDQFRNRYVLAFVLTWILVGSFMAYMLPAAGPCYWGDFVGGPNPYAELMERLRHDVAVSSTYNPVLDAQAYLLAAYDRTTVFGGGISAMPSMHIALATLFACGAWNLNRWFGMLLGAFAVINWWASIHLGWHYFVDGLVAIPVTLAIWLTAGKIYPDEQRQQQGQMLATGE